MILNLLLTYIWSYRRMMNRNPFWEWPLEGKFSWPEFRADGREPERYNLGRAVPYIWLEDGPLSHVHRRRTGPGNWSYPKECHIWWSFLSEPNNSSPEQQQPTENLSITSIIILREKYFHKMIYNKWII